MAPHRKLRILAACCLAATVASAPLAANSAPESMLDTDSRLPSCGQSPTDAACESDDVQLLQRDIAVKQHHKLAGAAAGQLSQCVETKDLPGSFKQRLTAFEETCLEWNPTAVEDPRPKGCMGPLEQLVGTWSGNGHAYTWVPTVPFPSQRRQGPTRTATPWYNETLTFEPIMGNTINKGYSDNDHLSPECQVEQALQGVMYTQEIRIGYLGELFQLLHYETGMLMYNTVPGGDSGWSVMRTGAIPRGINFYSQGSHSVVQGSDAKSQLLQEISALDLELLPADKCINGEGHIHPPESDVFNRDAGLTPELTDMHRFLKEPIQRQFVDSFTKIDFPESTSSINPFLQNAATPVDFKSSFIISSVRDKDGTAKQQLQYAQRLEVEFFQRLDCMTCPSLTRDADGCYPNVTEHLSECFVDNSLDQTCSERPFVRWPHVTVGTLTKIA